MCRLNRLYAGQYRLEFVAKSTSSNNVDLQTYKIDHLGTLSHLHKMLYWIWPGARS